MTLFRRCADPGPFAHYQRYKKYLRGDFHTLCAYCEVPEGYFRTGDYFGVEHLRPRRHFPELSETFSNLYYCCNGCNSFKGSAWPASCALVPRVCFVDPCREDLYAVHFRLNDDYTLDPLSKSGAFMIGAIHLNRTACVEFRRRKHESREWINGIRKRTAAERDERFRTLLEETVTRLEEEWASAYMGQPPSDPRCRDN